MLPRLFRSSLAVQSSSFRPPQSPRRRSHQQELAPALAQPIGGIHNFLHLDAGARLKAEVANQPRPRHPNSPPNTLSLHHRETMHSDGRTQTACHPVDYTD